MSGEPWGVGSFGSGREQQLSRFGRDWSMSNEHRGRF